MANMSYCRFENTLEDLKDCAEHISDNAATDEEDGISREEVWARSRLIKVCKRIVEDAEENDIS